MPGWLGWIVIATLLAGTPAGAEPLECPDPRFEVLSDDDALAQKVCAFARESAEKLAACNVPISETRRVRIELVTEMPEECLGLYYCGEDKIEIPMPEVMQSMRLSDSSLSHVSPEAFFRSIIVHELAHAAFDEVPCPFGSCITASEYVAYNMQVMSLPEADITIFETGLDKSKKISRDFLNPVILFMAPDTFMTWAWIHLNQRPDACAYIDDVMEGRVRLDYERP
tara:strand:- start:150 stop:827 length:678 start_codon:yes stop_codon:yes gene_type:complete